MSTHIPGPWAVRLGVCRNDHPDTSADVQGPDGQFVADCGCHDQANANARLIAAAPDLLAACKALLNDMDAGLLVRDITRDGEPGWAMHMLAFVQRLQAAQTAIAKAEGR